jgi:hypothetical protein
MARHTATDTKGVNQDLCLIVFGLGFCFDALIDTDLRRLERDGCETRS